MSPIPDTLEFADAPRREAFRAWIGVCAAHHGLRPQTLRAASADASFRRYLRIDADDGSTRIVMDAPPPHEDVRPFVDVARRLHQAALHVPAVLDADVAQGFLLLADLGQALYLDVLRAAVIAGDDAGIDRLMREAIAALLQLQRHGDADGLPTYDDALLKRELSLFPDWCVAREFGRSWSDAERTVWQQVSAQLVASALAQPRVLVHRDWMPRNLMLATPNPGVLDFQDAVAGPITYDIASLLRDAFISWDEERELDWAVRHWESARSAGLPVDTDFGEHWRALEWMGLQRHLKVLGIFCRLKHRDAKPHYSADLPRFFAYAHKVASRYRPLVPLTRLLEPLMG